MLPHCDTDHLLSAHSYYKEKSVCRLLVFNGLKRVNAVGFPYLQGEKQNRTCTLNHCDVGHYWIYKQSMGPTHGRTSMMYELANYEHTVDLWNITLSH